MKHTQDIHVKDQGSEILNINVELLSTEYYRVLKRNKYKGAGLWQSQSEIWVGKLSKAKKIIAITELTKV